MLCSLSAFYPQSALYRLIFKPRSIAERFIALPSFFFLIFLVLSVTTPEPPRMMSSSANYRPFLSSFRHIPPQEGFVKLTV